MAGRDGTVAADGARQPGGAGIVAASAGRKTTELVERVAPTGRPEPLEIGQHDGWDEPFEPAPECGPELFGPVHTDHRPCP